MKKEIDLVVQAARVASELDAEIIGIGHFVLAALDNGEKSILKDFKDGYKNGYLKEYVREVYSADNIQTSVSVTPFTAACMKFCKGLVDSGDENTYGEVVKFIKRAKDYDKFLANFTDWILENNFDTSKVFDKMVFVAAEAMEEFPFVSNLNEKVKKFNPIVIGRDKETIMLTEALLKKNKPNACLVGDAGVGKTAIVELLAEKINAGEVPAILKNSLIYELNVGELIAGTKYRGEFEEKLTRFLKVVKDIPNIILFIDEFHQLIDAGGAEGATAAGNILKPYLARGEIRVIGATTYEEYHQFIDADKAFERRFEKIKVSEPSASETLEILCGLKDSMEKFHEIKIEKTVLKELVNLTGKYMANRHFPDKAIDILDSACASSRIVGAKKLTLSTVVFTIEKKSGVKITKNAGQDLRTQFKEVLKGQDEAIDSVCETLNLIDMGLVDADKPMATLFFAGPTGVGKTEMAKQIARIYFGSEDRLVRVDMSEYSSEADTSKLLGAAPGYVGYEQESVLISGVKKQPYAVVLLDEIEKASNAVKQSLLRMLDEGFLTSASGEIVDFRHTIIIMTSNVGYHEGDATVVSFGSKATEKKINNAYEDSFSPEFRNRIEKTVIFNSLTKDVIKDIADGYAKQFGDYKLDDADVEIIMDNCDVKTDGARKIKTIVRTVIIPQKIKERSSVVL